MGFAGPSRRTTGYWYVVWVAESSVVVVVVVLEVVVGVVVGRIQADDVVQSVTFLKRDYIVRSEFLLMAEDVL